MEADRRFRRLAKGPLPRGHSRQLFRRATCGTGPADRPGANFDLCFCFSPGGGGKVEIRYPRFDRSTPIERMVTFF